MAVSSRCAISPRRIAPARRAPPLSVCSVRMQADAAADLGRPTHPLAHARLQLRHQLLALFLEDREQLRVDRIDGIDVVFVVQRIRREPRLGHHRRRQLARTGHRRLAQFLADRDAVPSRAESARIGGSAGCHASARARQRPVHRQRPRRLTPCRHIGRRVELGRAGDGGQLEFMLLEPRSHRHRGAFRKPAANWCSRRRISSAASSNNCASSAMPWPTRVRPHQRMLERARQCRQVGVADGGRVAGQRVRERDRALADRPVQFRAPTRPARWHRRRDSSSASLRKMLNSGMPMRSAPMTLTWSSSADSSVRRAGSAGDSSGATPSSLAARVQIELHRRGHAARGRDPACRDRRHRQVDTGVGKVGGLRLGRAPAAATSADRRDARAAIARSSVTGSCRASGSAGRTAQRLARRRPQRTRHRQARPKPARRCRSGCANPEPDQGAALRRCSRRQAEARRPRSRWGSSLRSSVGNAGNDTSRVQRQARAPALRCRLLRRRSPGPDPVRRRVRPPRAALVQRGITRFAPGHGLGRRRRAAPGHRSPGRSRTAGPGRWADGARVRAAPRLHQPRVVRSFDRRLALGQRRNGCAGRAGRGALAQRIGPRRQGCRILAALCPAAMASTHRPGRAATSPVNAADRVPGARLRPGARCTAARRPRRPRRNPSGRPCASCP